MPIIYHYTDAAAFVSILTYKKLRLSSARKMNDRNEIVGMERRFDNEIRDIYKRGGGPTQGILETLFLNRPDIYICCFSAARDATVQWVNYADGGRGVALGFDADELWKNDPSLLLKLSEQVRAVHAPATALPTKKQVALEQVEYINPDTETTIVDAIVQAYMAGQHDKGAHMAMLLHACAAIFKSPAFEHEREWRLMYSPVFGAQNQEGDQFQHLKPRLWRAGKYGTTPYYEFQFAPAALKEIWLGPLNVDAEPSSGHLLAEMVRDLGFESVNVVPSKCPLR